MRPVNLIPSEERRDTRAPTRSGPLAYIVVGALVALLAGVTLLVFTDNQISDREAEVTTLKAENSAAEAQAARLDAYTQFHNVRNQRVITVTNLANSRFDWERVVNELSLILPDNVWLTNLTGTVSPGIAVAGSAGVALRSSIPGPALEMVGCANGQDAVADFVSDLKDIDGVTRVGVEYSKLGTAGESAATGATEPSSESASGNCQTRDFIAQFQLVVAFDAAPAPTATSAVTAVAPTSTTPEG